jgi:type 1 fimbria pilin
MLKKALLSFAIVAFSGSVLAAPTANIYVKGKIGAPTCTVNGQDTADIVYNYDVELLENSYITSTNLYRLPDQDKEMVIDCDAATAISFDIIDARDDSTFNSNDENPGYGLGMYLEEMIGYYNIKFMNLKVKETPQSDSRFALIVRDGDTTDTGQSGAALIYKGENISWGVDGEYAIARQFSADLRVTPYINAELKNVAEEVELDGLAILSFSFGI